MLEARLPGTATLKRILDPFRELTREVNFDCDDKGIQLHALDNNLSAIIFLKLDAVIFMEYVCDRPITLSVNLESLNKALECAEKGDTCTLKVSDDRDVLTLIYEEPSGLPFNAPEDSSPPPHALMSFHTTGVCGVAECHIHIKVEKNKTDRFAISDLVYDAQVTMASSEFALVVNNHKALSEYVTIKVSKEGVLFETDGGTVSGKVFLKRRNSVKGGDGGVQIEMTQDVSLKVSLRHLVEFSKSAAFSDTVQLMLRFNALLLVSYKFVQGKIQYYLVNEDYE